MGTTGEAYPFEKLYIDTLGPLPESQGLKHILVCKDGYTKFVILVGLVDLQTQTIITALQENVFKLFGLPDKIISDNYSTLNSEAIKDMCKLLNITKRSIIAYNPNANTSERSNRDILHIFRAITSEEPGNWANFIASTN